MNYANQYDDYPHLRDSEQTLNRQLLQTRRIEWMLFCVDALIAALFWESDIGDLQRISLPFWWMFAIVFLRAVTTVCIYGYFSSTLRYLCIRKPSVTVQKLKGSERQECYELCKSFEKFFGGIAGVGSVIMAIIPHVLMGRRPDYHFFGFITAKVTFLTVMGQAVILARASGEIKAGIKEWGILLRILPGLSFAEYAEKYDGYEESLFD